MSRWDSRAAQPANRMDDSSIERAFIVITGPRPAPPSFPTSDKPAGDGRPPLTRGRKPGMRLRRDLAVRAPGQMPRGPDRAPRRIEERFAVGTGEKGNSEARRTRVAPGHQVDDQRHDAFDDELPDDHWLSHFRPRRDILLSAGKTMKTRSTDGWRRGSGRVVDPAKTHQCGSGLGQPAAPYRATGD